MQNVINVTKIKKAFAKKFIELPGTWIRVKSKEIEGAPLGCAYNYIDINLPLFCRISNCNYDAANVTSLPVCDVL